MTGLDTSPLTDAIDRREVRAFTARLRSEGTIATGALTIITLVIVGVAGVIVAVPVIAGIAASVFADDGVSPVGLLVSFVLLAVIALIIVAIVRGFGGAAARRYRLNRFARANGMQWHPGYDDPDRPGMIFRLGRDRQTHDLMRRPAPRFVEVANYRYETGSGKNKATHKWGYVALRLDTPLPHIVLDAVGNNGLFGGSNLPVHFGTEQRLSLEGDFDRYFALYCPAGYERDALYLFTPDVMARFIDNAATLDVEIIDDWLFLYARRDLSTLDPATWQWLFGTVAAIDDKLAQWARWRDDRLAVAPTAGAAASGIPGSPAAALRPPPVGVAREGRRLRQGIPWVTLLVVAGVFAAWTVIIVLFR